VYRAPVQVEVFLRGVVPGKIGVHAAALHRVPRGAVVKQRQMPSAKIPLARP